MRNKIGVFSCFFHVMTTIYGFQGPENVESVKNCNNSINSAQQKKNDGQKILTNLSEKQKIFFKNIGIIVHQLLFVLEMHCPRSGCHVFARVEFPIKGG